MALFNRICARNDDKITLNAYATNSELGFDYLRDNMATIFRVVQREFQFCVIESRLILIDEARTPLIISGQVERPQEKYQKAA